MNTDPKTDLTAVLNASMAWREALRSTLQQPHPYLPKPKPALNTTPVAPRKEAPCHLI